MQIYMQKKHIPQIVRNIFPQLLLTLIACLMTIASYAECVISSNTNLSTFNPDGCNGIIRVTNGDTLYVNAVVNVTPTSETAYVARLYIEWSIIETTNAIFSTAVLARHFAVIPQNEPTNLEFKINEFSEFWFHGNSNGNTCPLPVHLASFDAKCEQNEIKITWSTYSEVNNDFFIVERSADLETWNLLDTVNGAGNSNALLQYTVSDSRPLSNLSYYRLTQVDFDGKRKIYSPTSAPCSVNDVEIDVYPNPASHYIIINFGSSIPDATLDFIDMQGKSVRKDVIEAQSKSSSNEVKINRNELASGIYLIRLQIQGNEPLIKKVIFN